jgi:phospholipid/cholesterol/gamma-HCH transport system substrate-binding protein
MTGNRNLSVGLFVLAALTIGFVLTVWITGQRGTVEVTPYSVLVENDVTGLAVGGPVFFLGVKVGLVEDTVIVPGDPAVIRVDIEVEESTPVNGGTWATLAPQGITGVSVINLSNDPGAQGPVQRVEGQPYPVIPYRDSGFSAILSSAPAVLTKIEDVLDSANEILNEGNQASVAETLENIRTLSEALASEQAALARLPGEIDRVLTELAGASAQVRGLLEEVAPEAKQAVVNLELGTARLASLAVRLEEWSAAHERDLDTFADDGLAQFTELVGESRSTVRELEKLLTDLRREPSSLVYRGREEAVPVDNR